MPRWHLSEKRYRRRSGDAHRSTWLSAIRSVAVIEVAASYFGMRPSDGLQNFEASPSVNQPVELLREFLALPICLPCSAPCFFARCPLRGRPGAGQRHLATQVAPPVPVCRLLRCGGEGLIP